MGGDSPLTEGTGSGAVSAEEGREGEEAGREEATHQDAADPRRILRYLLVRVFLFSS